MMMYLGTPVMPDLNALVTTGLYINDLSMHDFSRFVIKIVMEKWKVFFFLLSLHVPCCLANCTTCVKQYKLIAPVLFPLHPRDLMLAGTQQSVELKLALDQEQLKSKKLEESMRKLDEEMKRTDELLYQMIPKQVADRLRSGENPIDTCQVNRTVN